MYEDRTYEALLESMLRRTPDDIDKREGSLIYTASGGAALELARYYAELDVFRQQALVQTAEGAFLDQLVFNKNVVRIAASQAVRRAVFTGDDGQPYSVPLGEVFTADGLRFVVTAADQVTCETAGTIGNTAQGLLLPTRTIQGLARAELAEAIIPGRDVETDDALRARFMEYDGTAFGGNIADYKAKTLGIDGVGAVRVYPIWDGGGTVKLVILDALLLPPAPELVAIVQELIDPEPYHQLGYGIAPIGHWVTVEGAPPDVVTIEATLVLFPDAPTQATANASAAIAEYITGLAKGWSAGVPVVQVSGIISAAIAVEGVRDIQDVRIQGASGNYAVPGDAVPIAGEVTLNAPD